MSDGIDAFFEHHGVKGMHWGIRNKKELTKEQKKDALKALIADKKFRDRKQEIIKKWFELDDKYYEDLKTMTQDEAALKFDRSAKKFNEEHKKLNEKFRPKLPDDLKLVFKIPQMRREVKQGLHPRHLTDEKLDFHIERLKKELNVKHSSNVDVFFEHHGVKGMQRPKSPERLSRVARVATGTETKKSNIQKTVKAKLKALTDAIKAEEKRRKEYEDALKELDEAKKDEPDEESSEFIKKHSTSNVKEFVSEDKPAATSNE